ncbi:Transcription initiation factor TFIID 55 kDa subunit [Mycena indigotica]|uniref:Transcription initiation factor TFIID 55 kDa subunit n=1 Tax=Mycena indigotica TaxID=2126181 RepID=A0A8H6S844_9AGAR|nr:Transcription initiation factor TFIID 55 kDa subunit [Mycena indigotica]KAF7294770.1 Transcription initiation factor TFIID 55 kDa subunit [Mycena indigotica]
MASVEDDLIVVDDEPIAAAVPLPVAPIPSAENSSSTSGATPRLRSSSRVVMPAPITPSSSEATDRATRSRSKPQPKLKLKLGEKAAQMAPGMSFLGPYDRELDSDDEDLSFEEHFILRMPPGEDCDKLRKMVASREVPNDVWFKFKDSRRAIFHIGNNTYSAKLVDLPCITESQKTLDNKQMFKVADICQMLVVQNRLDQDEAAAPQRNFNIEEFIWPHGLTPPLHHVRKRRFRKRVNKRTIESVEQAVERLLDEDSLATEVKYDVLENVNPDLSDSEFIEREDPIDAPTPAISDSGGMGEAAEDDSSGSEQEGDIDEELAAELDLALGDEEGDGDDEEDDDSDSDEEDDDDDEAVQSIRLLNEEIRDLEAAITKKGSEIASSANPLIKKRFEDALKKLNADLAMKQAQREEIREQQRMEQEGVLDTENEDNMDMQMQMEMEMGMANVDPQVKDDDDDQPEGDGDLFGSDTEMPMA